MFFACAPHLGAPAPLVAGPVALLDVPEVLAPRPFDALALAAGIPQGTRIRLRIESAGEITVEQRWEFARCTATDATIRSTVHDAAGVLIKDEGESTTSWAELEKHASFPAANTERGEGVSSGPLGPLDVWLYTVTVPGGDGVMLVKHFEFARALPGPPVVYTIERQGEEIFRMTMLERTPG
ncbi:MAG: hypothetical protein EXR69_09955 [Myxococcales bacterium]|nr:hypothetical protein [Myxococcales bacterium]